MIIIVLSLIYYSKLSDSTYSTWIITKHTNKKRDISENSGGTLCMSETINFAQKYTVATPK